MILLYEDCTELSEATHFGQLHQADFGLLFFSYAFCPEFLSTRQEPRFLLR